jgi:hypothetical protein
MAVVDTVAMIINRAVIVRGHKDDEKPRKIDEVTCNGTRATR